MWFDLKGDERLGRCATAGCGGQPTSRLEANGVGSNYCSGCRSKISGSLDSEIEIAKLRVHGQRFIEWIENLYGDLPRECPPGPPIRLLEEMRKAFAKPVNAPAPWHFDHTGTVLTVYADNDWPIAKLCESTDENNARLIAAAPDMLGALKHCIIERSDWLDEARAAVAKAEGR